MRDEQVSNVINDSYHRHGYEMSLAPLKYSASLVTAHFGFRYVTFFHLHKSIVTASLNSMTRVFLA